MALTVLKKSGETNQSLVFRFRKAVQKAGILLEARKQMYHDRKPNERVIKERALRRVQKQKEYERLKKLGKI